MQVKQRLQEWKILRRIFQCLQEALGPWCELHTKEPVRQQEWQIQMHVGSLYCKFRTRKFRSENTYNS